jgi:hypothetical protein
MSMLGNVLYGSPNTVDAPVTGMAAEWQGAQIVPTRPDAVQATVAAGVTAEATTISEPLTVRP